MHTGLRFRGAVAALAATALLGGCAPAGLDPQGTAHPEIPTSATPTPQGPGSSSPTPTDTPSPTPPPPVSPSPSASTPAPDPGGSETPPDGHGLVPGSNHIASAAGYVHPAATVQGWLKGENLPTEKVVFLTFDDGPNPVTTPIILAALRDADVHATFFVLGNQLAQAPDMLLRTLEEGNSINLHSWSHDYGYLYPKRHANADRIEDEYLRTVAEVRRIVGDDFDTQGWRYPGGHMSWKSLGDADARLAAHGVSWIDWNADTRDSAPKASRPTTVDQIVANATEPIRQGMRVAVVLGHDTREKKLTADSVSSIIAAYKAAGYTFGVIS